MTPYLERGASAPTCVIALLVLGVACSHADTYDPAPSPSFDGYQHGKVDVESNPQLPTKVTLAQAIDEALRRAAQIAASGEQIAQARGDLITASRIPNPTFMITTSLQPLPGTQFTFKHQGGPPQYDVLITENVDPLVFGKRSAAMTTARKAMDMARSDFADVRRLRAGETAAAFFDVLVAKEQVQLTKESVEQLERVERLIEGRVNTGDTAIIDLDRARLNTRVARREAREALVNLTQARSSLRELMGRSEADPAIEVLGSLDITVAPEPPIVDIAFDEARALRPDIVSATRAVEKAEAALRSAEREAYPTLALMVGATYQHQHPIGQTDARSMGGGFAVSLPTFDRNQGNIAVARSKLNEARLSLEAVLVSLRAEVEQIVAAYTQARESVRIDSEESVNAARDVRDRVQASYREGGSNLLELLDAQRAYQDAIRTRVALMSNFWHARFGLETTLARDAVLNGHAETSVEVPAETPPSGDKP